jgi:hypothetical protein
VEHFVVAGLDQHEVEWVVIFVVAVDVMNIEAVRHTLSKPRQCPLRVSGEPHQVVLFEFAWCHRVLRPLYGQIEG